MAQEQKQESLNLEEVGADVASQPGNPESIPLLKISKVATDPNLPEEQKTLANIDEILALESIAPAVFDDEDDDTDDGYPRDVDKGWAWVVLLGGFLAFSLLSGPLASYLILRFGCRITIMIGGICASIGYLGTAGAPNLGVAIFTYGILAALGLSLNFSGWVIALGTYFQQKHSIATALAMTGFGCGLFFLGPAVEACVSFYSWRGSCLINAGLALHFCVFGALVFPIVVVTQHEDEEEEQEKKESLEEEKVEEKKEDGETKGDAEKKKEAQEKEAVQQLIQFNSVTIVPGVARVPEMQPLHRRSQSASSLGPRTASSGPSSLHGSIRDIKFSPAAAYLSHSIRSLTEATRQQSQMGASSDSFMSLPAWRSNESFNGIELSFRERSQSFREEVLRHPFFRHPVANPEEMEDVDVMEDIKKMIETPIASLFSTKRRKDLEEEDEPSASVPEVVVEAKLEDVEKVKKKKKKKKFHAPYLTVPIGGAGVIEEVDENIGSTTNVEMIRRVSREVVNREPQPASKGSPDHPPAPVDPLPRISEKANEKNFGGASKPPPEASKLTKKPAELHRSDPTLATKAEATLHSKGEEATTLSAAEEQEIRGRFRITPIQDEETERAENQQLDNAVFVEISRAKSHDVEMGIRRDGSCDHIDESPLHPKQEGIGLFADASSVRPNPEIQQTTKAFDDPCRQQPVGATGSTVTSMLAECGSETHTDLGATLTALASPTLPPKGQLKPPCSHIQRQVILEQHLCDLSLLTDVRFWCFNVSGFMWIMGTLTLYVMYKDFAVSRNIEERFIYALSGIGLGDLIGRLFSGTFASWSFIDSVLIYALIQLVCGAVILYHMVIVTVEQLIFLCTAMGMCYGMQNVLLAVAPGEVYGPRNLTMVFGYILFWCGLGALVGPPVAGFLEAKYSYDAAFIFAGVSTLSGGLATLTCFFVDRHHKRRELKMRKDQHLLSLVNSPAKSPAHMPADMQDPHVETQLEKNNGKV
ncbi:unnamed protein product [Darwinula stevensoni]|uniref:Uncharacterized protein n=1 Tax=Darwinula stevensoni TaxID=69355 RepID=A0A7R8XJ20_9CRUS|nr:unnamed protein product [Darwinula stevensoni]CAG0894387.1 unnamed protein product [Darwinula stevensoni]